MHTLLLRACFLVVIRKKQKTWAGDPRSHGTVSEPLIEKLDQQTPLNFRVDSWEAIVIAGVAADIF